MFSLQGEWARYDEIYGAYAGPRLVTGPGGPQIITGGGRGGTGDELGADSNVSRVVLKDVDGDGDTEEVSVPATEYVVSTNPDTGTKTISIVWADGVREETVITRDGRETYTASFPEGGRVVETTMPGGASSYTEYDAENNVRVISITDSEGNETRTEYGGDFVTESRAEGDFEATVIRFSDGRRIELEEDTGTGYKSSEEYSANGQLQQSQTRYGDGSEEIYMLMPNGKGITYRSGPRFGDNAGESVTIDRTNVSQRETIDNVTDELQNYTGDGRDNSQNGTIEINDEVQKYRVETILGTASSDHLIGKGLLAGGSGGDTLIGSIQSDILIGGAGNDVLTGGAGADILDGGEGYDFVVYTTGVTANLTDASQNTGEAAGDTYEGVEGLYGSNSADRLTGNALNNTIYGGWGEDMLSGLSGDDHLLAGDSNDNLVGGAGADTLDGGNGFDYAEYHTATSGVVVDLLNAWRNTGDAAGDSYVSIEGLTGSAYNDELAGNHAGNEIYGGGGDDVLEGGGGADWLHGGAGYDFASYFNATAGVRVSLANSAINTGEAYGDVYNSIEALHGSQFGDVLLGNGEGNNLYGHNGNDELFGGAGRDYMVGGAHYDTLSGGDGSDWLVGGSGADVFRFDAVLGSSNVDEIVDFNAMEGDRIELETHMFRAFPDVALVETTYSSYYVNEVMKSTAFGLGAWASTSAQRIVYNQATGALFYDADGTGAAAQVQFAQLKAGTALSAANFGLFTL